MNKLIALGLLVCIAAFLAGMIFSERMSSSSEEKAIEAKVIETETAYSVCEPLLAADENGVGRLAQLCVQSTEGSGRVFIQMNLENPLMNTETQSMVRKAIIASETATRKSSTQSDLFYSVSAKSHVVGGESAGAATAIATIAVLTKRKIREDTVITGTISTDGKIGVVSHAMEKAIAAKAAGYRRIIVPKGNAISKEGESKCTIETSGSAEVKKCGTVYESKSIAGETGMQVIEVEDIREAMAEMIQ